MRLSILVVHTVLATVSAAIKTSIYIDQVPGYSALAPCAEDRVSAIVRAQASGCGDNQQLTSFSCFCIDQSSLISSVISTAVQERCSAQASNVLATLTSPLPEVTAALAVFNSYCARSTELAWYQANSTAGAGSPITAAPSSTFATSTSSTSSSPIPQPAPSSKTVPVAAIAAPVVIGVLAIAGVVGLLLFLRRRKAAKAAAVTAEVKPENPYTPATYPSRGELEHGGVHEVQSPVQEMVGDTVKYRYELDNRPAELEGGKAGDARR
ncbi:hypothetical protein SVAN01_08179 [Stagonosporopsis vannaccii]|nr:hypothetical protein SVAN01_08179 [Stagonosporopsis vannaccii]